MQPDIVAELKAIAPPAVHALPSQGVPADRLAAGAVRKCAATRLAAASDGSDWKAFPTCRSVLLCPATTW